MKSLKLKCFFTSGHIIVDIPYSNIPIKRDLDLVLGNKFKELLNKGYYLVYIRDGQHLSNLDTIESLNLKDFDIIDCFFAYNDKTKNKNSLIFNHIVSEGYDPTKFNICF